MSENEIKDLTAAINELKNHIDTRINEAFPQLYSVEEVCDIIGISKRTFHNWQKKGPVFTIVHYRGVKRVPRSSLDAYLNHNQITGKY